MNNIVFVELRVYFVVLREKKTNFTKIIFNTFLDGIEKKEILLRLYKLVEKFPVNKRPFIIRLIIKNTGDQELKKEYMLKTDKAIKCIHDKELMKKLLDKLIYGNTDHAQ